MKRKNCLVEDSNISKRTRMALANFDGNKSIDVASGGDVKQSLERHFSYVLSDKKAKSNLIQGASRDPLGIDEKDGCTMITFSTGSYLEAVIPTVSGWVSSVRRDIINNVKVEEAVPSFDKNNKHVETILRFRVNSQKVTVTAYYTTQRIKVEGRGYLEFGNNFIIPLLKNKIKQVPAGRIEQYNKDVIAALSGKRKVISRPVRSVKYKAMAKLPCTKCELTFSNNGQLNKHKRELHTSTGNESLLSINFIPSTDNISLVDVTDDEAQNVDDKTQNDRTKQLSLEEVCPSEDVIQVVTEEVMNLETPLRCDEKN